jgi:hypothetical protein
MALPAIDIFERPYEAWQYRTASVEEMLSNTPIGASPCLHVKDKLLAIITNSLEAAIYMAKVGADNALGQYINNALDNNLAHRLWRNTMPSRIPNELSEYQRRYSECDLKAVDEKINQYGILLPNGQVLFHGGTWSNGNLITTDRPLSTTFCPQVALRNAEHNGKAYGTGKIDLFVLKFCNCKSKAYVYKRHGSDQGHENEVLIASGAKLTLHSETLISENYTLYKHGYPQKICQISVLDIYVS